MENIAVMTPAQHAGQAADRPERPERPVRPVRPKFPEPSETGIDPAGTAEEPPRAVHREYRRRCRIPVGSALTAAAGTAVGAFAAATAGGLEYSGSILCSTGSFWEILGMRLLWGAAFLLAEYILGFFALGDMLVWAVPLVCGLGTGAALTGAFSLRGISAALLIPSCAASVGAVICGAGVSAAMSAQLLRLVSTDKSSIVAARPAAGEYTLRFLVCLAILLGSFIAEAAFRSFSA